MIAFNDILILKLQFKEILYSVGFCFFSLPESYRSPSAKSSMMCLLLSEVLRFINEAVGEDGGGVLGSSSDGHVTSAASQTLMRPRLSAWKL